MKRPILFSVFAATLAASLLVACGGGGGYSAPSGDGSPVPQSVSTIVPLSDVGAPIALPGFEGFTESITLPSNGAPGDTNADITVSTTHPSGVPPLSVMHTGLNNERADSITTPPPGSLATVIYGSITSPVTVTFTGQSAFSVTAPPGFPGVGGGIGVAYYDPTVGLWNVIGDAVITEDTMAFSVTTPITLTGGVTYSLGLYELCPSCYADGARI